MTNFKKYIIPVLVVLLIVSCSTKKNTGITRFYHNLTSHYNILFNGEESFKKGMEKLETDFDDDFTALLPVFLFENKEALNGISSEMDRSIKKMTKLISMHSLTVKPEVKPDKQISQKQKEFLSKKEYNRYIDDAYLLMGKSHFYKYELTQAEETFNYIISNFPEESSAFEAKIWLARQACQEGNYREADDMLTGLSNNLDLPKRLRGELYSSIADLKIKEKKLKEAVDPLEKAIDFTGSKFLRIRYTFLLAQLYNQEGNNSKASENYGRVIKMNPPYKMAFSAKINRALAYESGTSSGKDIEKELRKMLKDDKNIDFQDQIYYALGSLYIRNNQVDKAVENYILSIQKSTDNKRQKARSSLTLADLYYARPDYIHAQSYYDSAIAVIDKDYPNYQSIHAKSVSLNELVNNIKIVQFEDSVLKLSKMPDDELMALIDDEIEKYNNAEEEKRLKEQELVEERMADMSGLAVQTTQNQGNWYFYNPTTKTLGRKEFVRLWGNRKLEDNWRRKNKNVMNFEVVEDTGEDTEDVISPGVIVTDKRTRQYYLQYIPRTDSAKAESLERIRVSLYKMGEIYSDELKDYPKANESFEELLRRFPSLENKLQVYFKLYTISKNTEDINRLNKYQQAIIREYPNSNFAKLMTNPDYVKEIAAEEKIVFDYYDETYILFKSDNYAAAAERSSYAMKQYPGHELYSRFDYMYTISQGIKKDTLSFVNDLQKLVSRYPSTDIAQNAQILISYLENKSPQVVVQQNLQIARELYMESGNETHYFAFIVPVTVNVNQLIFNVVNFNLDNFDNLKLEVKRQNLDGKKILCMVSKFNNGGEAMIYLRKIAVSPDVLKDVETSGIIPIVISQSNLAKLTESAKIDQYLLFYERNYK